MLKVLSAHGIFSLARAFISAVLAIYLLNKGVSLSVIALAKSAQLVTSVLFNYPAGLFSDRFGNKKTILLACVSEIIYFSLMLEPTDNRVIVGEIFNGLGIALYMGAFEAWLFTYKNDTEDSFSLISRKSEMLFIATIISGFIGAVFSQYSLWLSIIFMVVSFCVYAVTPDKPVVASSGTAEQPGSGGIISFFKRADFNVFSYVIAGGLMQLIFQFWPVFFKNMPFSYSTKDIGLIFAGSMIAQWLLTRYSRKKNLNKKKHASVYLCAGLFITSLATVILPGFVADNAVMVVFIYFLFISLATLTVNYFFSRGCNIFSGMKNESSMISLLDTSARCFGALCLGIVSLSGESSVSIIWSSFPVFVLFIVFCGLIKKSLPARTRAQ